MIYAIATMFRRLFFSILTVSVLLLIPPHQTVIADSQLMEELQVELDPALTEPIVLKTEGTLL